MAIARPPWFKVVISLVFFFGFYLFFSAANSGTLQINEVLHQGNIRQTLQEFHKVFLNEPIKINTLRQIKSFSGATSKNNKLNFNLEKVEDSLFRKINSIPNTKILNFQQNNNNSNYYFEKKFLKEVSPLMGNNNFYKLPLYSNKKFLYDEVEQKFKNDNIFLSSLINSKESGTSSKRLYENSPLQIEDWGETIVTLVLSLIFVLLLIYLTAFCYKKFFRIKFSSIKGNVNIRQVSSYYVGPKQKVIVFDFNGRKFACGVTPSSINLIAELYDEIENEDLNLENEDVINNKKKNKSRTKFLNALEPEMKKIKKYN